MKFLKIWILLNFRFSPLISFEQDKVIITIIIIIIIV